MGAEGEFFVCQAGIFAPKDEGGFVVRSGIEDDGGDFARQAGMVAIHAGSGAGARNDGALGNCFFQSLEGFSGIEKRIGVAGETSGFVPVVPLVRVNDGEVGDAHVHHDPADGADVTGALGLNEHDSDIFEWIHRLDL